MAGDQGLRSLFRAIRKAGGEVEQLSNGHYRVTLDGEFVTVLGATPSDYRSRLNAIAALRRAGLDIPKKHFG